MHISNWTIYDLKQRIYEQYGMDRELVPQRIELYYRGVKLELDHKTLEDYDIKKGATIFLRDKGLQVPMRACKLMIFSSPVFMLLVMDQFRVEIYQYLMEELNLNLTR
mmetsp:Transcript_1658/g.2933  ORF Transcript_1658/g.2933 Transcript_1658/m.2933 type:complete len:108 (-) Transcript_1658:726-1049(-)